jgi:O-antigen ligase
LLLITGVGLVLMVYGDQLTNNPVAYRTLTRLDIFGFSDEASFFETVRFDSWSRLVGLIGERPFFGFGYKIFESLHGFYIDNAYFIAYFEVGFLGFLAFVLFWLLLLAYFLGRLRYNSVYAKLGLIVLIPFMLRLYTGGANSDWSVAPLVFAFLGATYKVSSQRFKNFRRCA